jgi:hypothetical protein
MPAGAAAAALAILPTALRIFVDDHNFAFPTAAAFGTGDALPLTPRATFPTMGEAAISLVTRGVVASRTIDVPAT